MTAARATRPPVEPRVAEMHRQTRSPSGTAMFMLAGVAVAVLPLVPGASRMLGVTLADTIPAVAVYELAIVIATATYHATGLSRWYWIAEGLETWCSIGVVLYFVYASGSAISLWWLFFLIHGFFLAAIDPWPRNHALIPYVIGPVLVAAGFYAGAGTAADAAISLALGLSQVVVITTLSRTALRIDRLMAENTRLASDLAALRVEQERDRIARDLHDGLGAAMTSILWQARALETASDGAAGARATELCEQVTRSLDELRGIVTTIRPRTRPWSELVDELSRRCRAVAGRPVTIEARADDPARMIAGPLASECLLAALEMVRNADRHAGAGRIVLRAEAGDRVRLAVDDDGVGMPAGALDASDGGLANLRARARALGGDLHVRALEPGTRVELDVPITAGGAAG